MRYRAGKVIAYLACGVFIVLTIVWTAREGIAPVLLLFCAGAILSYEFADYMDYARFMKSVRAREVQPCLTCNTSGRLGRRRCPDCRGRGYVVAPPDRGRPPIL